MCEAVERVEHVVHDAGKDDDIERALARFAKGGAELRQSLTVSRPVRPSFSLDDGGRCETPAKAGLEWTV